MSASTLHSPLFPYSPDTDPRPAGVPWSYRDAAEALGVCEATVARAARSGRVASIRVGRRVFLTDAELRRLQREGF